MSDPILYTFRRCPFAMRARLALQAAGIRCEQREVALRAKPAALLEASPKGTVPVLVLPGGRVIDESLQIMQWALQQHDPEGWLRVADLQQAHALIAEADGPFKQHLDRYKYATRYEGADPLVHRAAGLEFLGGLEARLTRHAQLMAERTSLADIAIFPFVRQFSRTEPSWFEAQPLPLLQAWLQAHLDSARFAAVMKKQPVWQAPT